jgi:hypothetical protein
MTSSFRQRDPYAMGSTNYLATAPDLTDAMIKEQNSQIADTEEFFKQMAELEKQRADRPLKLLGDIADFAQSVGPIIQQVQDANDDRNRYQGTLGRYKGAKSDLDDELLIEQNRIENEEKQTRNEEKQFSENAKKNAEDPTISKEDRNTAEDASFIFGQGSFMYQDGLNSRNNLKEFSNNLGSYIQSASKYDKFTAIDNRMLSDATTVDEFNELFDFYMGVIFQNQMRGRRTQGLRDATDGEVLKYIAPEAYKQREKLLREWKENRQVLLNKAQAIRDTDEIGVMFQNQSTLAEDVLGKEGWITNRKTQLEARGLDASSASQLAFAEFGNILVPMLDDVGSGVDAGDVRVLLDQDFEFPGGTMKMNDPRAPKGAQRLHDDLTAAVLKYEEQAIERENEITEAEMLKWKGTNHVEFVTNLAKISDPREAADKVDTYVLDFRKRFNITNDEALPDFMKDFITSRQFSDESIVIEITSRRRNNLPITQSMIDKIVDPDIRAAQSKYVNTPELGAFTEDEAQDLETEKIPTLVRDAKQLSDLSKAKTDKFLVARDNAKEYVIARFKELVVGGQSRTTALTNALSEAKGFLADGTFDKEEILPIDTQATKDLQATMKAIGTDPSLIYSSEEWAGEAPHLAIAREYIRTGGKSRYPSYYMRFNFIKNTDGAYLTPEEIFKARVAKVDGKEESKDELPERKELDNIDDQNKLINKSNSTKTLDVALNNNNVDWMINSTSFTDMEKSAEAFIRRLEMNIQNQHPITGIGQKQYIKTTLSTEDNNKLFEAVPELKEAPFLHPNTLSTEAINAMLKLNI